MRDVIPDAERLARVRLKRNRYIGKRMIEIIESYKKSGVPFKKAELLEKAWHTAADEWEYLYSATDCNSIDK